MGKICRTNDSWRFRKFLVRPGLRTHVPMLVPIPIHHLFERGLRLFSFHAQLHSHGRERLKKREP
jgi:hypothetical protein